ncbi:transcription termination/antitermination NusG family protein [Chitinophaga oryzae]|uniref:Transcription termination/antitermination NusG family protein n=1 Tax=Chitinophaga oryzae TaxID=2725414 RepID=A0AAE6ZFD9_9BACT|nr:UpxY family transcription antiterminator [Chitinophaga oryzae]QJB31626.1 transcription termination/antitermination NusG family protein [Chitinophaga oryzae]QJB38110.1 transcription termination/antitermination NusG family protein [Chitinophaga oryzae]
MSTFNYGWYLIYTVPRQERKVVSQLLEHGMESFSPTYSTVRQWNDRKKIVELPLFPSYVFVKLNSIEEFYYGQHVSGAASYVRFGKQFARMEQDQIDQIRMVAKHGEDISVSEERFRDGQRLVITKGPLCGLSCEVVHVDQMKKILVRVDLLQRNIIMRFKPEYLAAIHDMANADTF